MSLKRKDEEDEEKEEIKKGTEDYTDRGRIQIKQIEK